MTTTDPRTAVLRAAGHTDAADLLDSLAGLNPHTTPAATGPPTQTDTRPAPPAGEQDARRRQGETLLEQLHRDTDGRWRQ